MITRAYIDGKIETVDGAQKVKIWVPIFEKSNEYDVLRNLNSSGVYAIIACPPNECPNFKEGDAVIIAFEDYVADSPVILGWLFGSNDDKGNGAGYNTYPDAYFNDVVVGNRLTVTKQINYIENTEKLNNSKQKDFKNINTKSINLEHISDLRDRAQAQIDTANENIELLFSKITEIGNSINMLCQQLEAAGILANDYFSSPTYNPIDEGSAPYGKIPTNKKASTIINKGTIDLMK